jgi:hypothetical protein
MKDRGLQTGLRQDQPLFEACDALWSKTEKSQKEEGAMALITSEPKALDGNLTGAVNG